jgi:beta-galactosidase
LPLEHAGTNWPSAGWGTAQVPGAWTDRDNVRGSDGRPARGRWAGRPLTDYPLGCYLRTFTVEPRWRQQPLLLTLDGVDGLAEIYLNGRLVGRLAAWEPEAYDVGDLLRFDRPNTLLIRLRARRDCRCPGIYGSVALEAMPRAFIKDVAVEPSVDRGEIRFSCDAWCAGEAAAGRLEFEIAPRAGDGPVEKRFRHEFRFSGREFTGRELSAACQRIQCTFPWRDARLWTYDDPALYGVRVRLYSGTALVDQPPWVRFGFREFTRRGSELLLNGKPTHLRGHQLALGGGDVLQTVKDFKAAGMNSFECLGPVAHTWYLGTPYRLAAYEQALDYADRNGMVAVPLLPDLMQIRERIFEPQVAERFRQRLDKHIRRFGNHPSICMWYMHFNLAGYHWYCAPSTWDGSYKPADATFQARERFAVVAQRMAAEFDRRPLFHHACGNFSDIFTANVYLGPNCPLQEREEWPLRWAAKRPFPLLACEHGMMLIPYWFRPRQFPLDVVYSGEPIFDEITAIYFGRRAYQMLTPEVFQAYDLGNRPFHERLRTLTGQHRGYQEVKSLFARQSLRAWRTFGVSGIFFNAIAWDFKDAAGRQLPVMRALGRYFGDTDLYIAGPGNDWPSKDHAFFGGETVRKQIVLLDDLTRDLPCRLAWRVQDASGAVCGSGKIETVAQAGAVRMCPLEFTAPQVARRTALRLTVEPLSAEPSPFRPDELAMEVFPRPAPATIAGRILLYDPVGDTAAMLSRAGIRAEPLTTGSDLRKADLLIVGRKGYGPALLALARRTGLERAVAEGLNLLVLEQTAGEVFGLRLHEQSQRHVFVACPGHPLLAGLAPEDFINLRGQSDLIDAYPDAPPGTERSWPARCFKWGNRGITATCVYTKPHYAPLVPILESGYDLTDSPLLEAAIDRGRVVLCQVDVTPRYGADPVATRLVDNLLRELAVRGTQPLLPCTCTGPSARAWVRPFGIEPEAFQAGRKSLIVVGTERLADAEKKSLLAAVEQGATALLLPGSRLAADAGLSTTPRRCFLARPGSDPLLAGVSDADLFLKAWTELPAARAENGWQALSEPAVVARKFLGHGQLVACLVDPARCGEHGRIKTLRLWNVLLANLHVRRLIDGSFLKPALPLYEANTWEGMPPYMNW